MTRRRVGVVAAVVALLVVGGGAAASAHPLGNATVNHYDGLHLYPDHVTDLAVEDIAEIPTLQRRSRIDTNGDGILSLAERGRYARRQCTALAAADVIAVNGARLVLAVRSSSYAERPGAIQLRIGRLECHLDAPAHLAAPARVLVDDSWDGAGIGWHEITAVATGVTLHDSPFPAASISDTLWHYPNDLLTSPLDVRSGRLATDPGSAASTYAAAKRLPVAGGALRLLNRLATTFNDLVGRRHLTVGVGLLAVLLSLTLGAGHAFLPGHGKTIMAAYLVGRRGRLRDVVLVGATVTVTHTFGVLALGLAISLTAAFAPTAAEQDLGIISGLIVAGVGVSLLVGYLRRRPWRAAPVVPWPEHNHGRLPGFGRHQHGSGPGAHHHGDGPGHSHGAPTSPSDVGQGGHGSRGFSRAGLVGLGLAGGLMPSPSALLVLLAAIALGRTAFGVVLVLGYGVGMASALSAAGLLLVRLRDRLSRLQPGRGIAGASRVAAVLPLVTATLVLAVGIGLTLRAASGTI